MVKSQATTVKMATSTSSEIGGTVKCALERAQQENRVVIGLGSVIQALSDAQEDAVFCIMAPPKVGDSATHMHETLLEAFCYENDIYVIKVDSSKKLSRILGSSDMEFCALIQRPWTSDDDASSSNECQAPATTMQLNLTLSEEALIDHCEEFWDSPKQPVIGLPV